MDYAFGSASRSSQYSRFFSSTAFFGTATRLRISTSGGDFVIMTRPFYASTWSVRWDGWTESAPEAPTTIPPRLRRGSSCVPLGDRAIPASGVHPPTSTVASLSTRPKRGLCRPPHGRPTPPLVVIAQRRGVLCRTRRQRPPDHVSRNGDGVSRSGRGGYR